MSSLETAIKRNTAKGRTAKKVLKAGKGDELETAEMIFSRTAPTWADFEFIHPIVSRAEAS